MKFTVVFPSRESSDYAYGLVFEPCVMWVKGESQVLVINSKGRTYVQGSVRKLLIQEQMGIDQPRDQHEHPYVVVVPHANGGGTERDLDALVTDLRTEGFWVRISRPIRTGQQ